jgi:quercetin dioxygenase-like cupin family protein
MLKRYGQVLALGGLLAAGVAVWGQQAASGTRREPQFENGEVKVWKSIILPNQPLSLHRHDHGRTIVTLKGGTLDVVDAAGTTLHKVVWEAGKAYWLDADPAGAQHGDVNRGAEPIEVIVVELKNDQKR